MERQFNAEIESLKLGAGETFHGEGILAVTKALLQSGVSYVGGYQGAPVSHLLDVMVQARDYMDELGVHVEACTNEASAAAMLGASINYPARGAVTWKSIVGTNVASDALTNLLRAGVLGGALIVVGEDYGEGASVAQERTHAVALKSSHVDARPAAEPRHYREPGGARLRAVGSLQHPGVHGPAHPRLPCARQLRSQAPTARPRCRTRQLLARSGRSSTMSTSRIRRPRSGRRKLKMGVRLPAARKYIREHQLNELIRGQREQRRHRLPGRPLQQPAARAASSSASPTTSARSRIPDTRAQRGLSAGAGGNRRLLLGQVRGAGGRRRPARIHRAGHRHHAAPCRYPDQAAWQGRTARWRANTPPK